MNPKTNPISSINSFLNKQFGVPLPKSTTPSSSFIGPTAPNMSYVPTKNMSMVPSNTGATPPKPTTITPPTTTKPTLPPAGQTFVQNQVQPAYDNVTGARTAYGASIGAKDMLGGKEVNPTGGNSTTGPVAPPKAPESPYLTYLKSMFDPDVLKTTSDNINQLNERTSNELLRTRKREDELRENKIGQLERGQSYQLGEEERLSNRSLADIAIAKGAATEVYKSMLDAGKSVFEAETAAKKAEQDQLNMDKKFSFDERAAKLAEDKLAQDKLEADRNFEEDKRQFGLEYALKKQEIAAKASEVTAAATGKDAEALSSMNLINTLLQNPNVGSISGFIQGKLGLGNLSPSSNTQLAKNQFEQIKGILALENRQKLKGQGAVSDFEGRTLERAASSLDRNLGDDEFVKQLKQVRGAIATSHGLSTDVLLVNPTTKESMIVLSDSAGIAQAIKDGLTVEYQ